mmetsp:Transcript_30528/g.93812  ORF Transcript_30528/g.93812 Transcript_30528/m.93812 type:complete len:445 (-) Transcript_30528:121-1455(-)
MRAASTAEGLRQSLRLPRATTSSCVSWSASRSCRAARPSILFSLMKSSTSGEAAGGSLAAVSASVPSGMGVSMRLRSKAMFSCATRMRPMSAVLGFWQSTSSPRSRTARCTSAVCARSADDARLSTSFSSRKRSISSSSSDFLGASAVGACCSGRSSGVATGAILASRIRARHTAEGLRQFLKFPRIKTLLCTTSSASRRALAAESSNRFSRINSSTSGEEFGGTPPGEAMPVSATARGVLAVPAALRSKFTWSFATWMRPMRAALGFWQSASSPRSKTARCTSGSCARRDAMARLSMSLLAMKRSTACSSSVLAARDICDPPLAGAAADIMPGIPGIPSMPGIPGTPGMPGMPGIPATCGNMPGIIIAGAPAPAIGPHGALIVGGMAPSVPAVPPAGTSIAGPAMPGMPWPLPAACGAAVKHAPGGLGCIGMLPMRPPVGCMG